nr:phosphatase PAP2 family protein [uncultured Bacteroides sp.]
MNMKYRFLFFVFVTLNLCHAFAQEDTIKVGRKNKFDFPVSDSVNQQKSSIDAISNSYDLNDFNKNLLASPYDQMTLKIGKPKKNSFFNSSYSRYIIPAALVSYGVGVHMNKSLREVDLSTNHEVGEHLSQPIPYDDYMQFAPAVAVYGLDFMGIKAKHNLRDRTMIMATSYLIMGAAVQVMKSTTHVARPDGSNMKSFPSGHTATAFVGAHILFKEYKDSSPWIGVSGYAVALATGTMRVLNKKHWVSDVAAGAGVGILSAELGYALLPVWHHVFGIKDKTKSLVILPAVSSESLGVGLVYNF